MGRKAPREDSQRDLVKHRRFSEQAIRDGDGWMVRRIANNKVTRPGVLL
jgi:hypothetical protein